MEAKRIEKVKALISNGGNWNGVVYAENYNSKNAEVGVYIDEVYYFLYNTSIAWVEGKKEDTLNELNKCVPSISDVDSVEIENDVQKSVNVSGYYDCEGGVEDITVTEVIYDLKDACNIHKVIVFKGDIPNISKSDDETEIKSFLNNKFKKEGFKVSLNLK